VAAAANAFVVADIAAPDAPVVDVNPAFEQMTGYGPDEVLGRNCRFLQGPGTDPETVHGLRHVIDARAETTAVLLNYRKDGTPFWNELYLAPMADESGDVRHYVGVQSDVTGRVRAAELEIALAAEREASRLKDEFLATMSHELRTPLTAITGYAELLGMDGGLAPTQADDIAQIAQSAGRLLGLIDDVLRLAELEAGRVALHRTALDLRDALAPAVAAAVSAAEAKGLELKADLPGDIQVYADPAALRQVVTTLVGNAVKFTEAGSIRVSALASDDEVEVVVSDSGPGIAPEVLPHIFAPFRQADGRRSRRHGGAGLGLAIADRLVRLHGEAIAVESEPGTGSTFTLRLPRV
jgi:PAS domain S-box-containing protein